MNKDQITMIKNLQNGNIYTPQEIANLVGVDVTSVNDVDSYVTKDILSQIKKSDLGVIYIMDIKYNTIVDGEGFRNTVYCAGCNIHCPSCHNQNSWNIYNGHPITIEELFTNLMKDKYDVTFSGGECTLQAKAFTVLAKMLKEEGKNIWLYSGDVFENLINKKEHLDLLRYVDVLVDGSFILKEKDLELLFKGSKNQRILNIPKSIELHKGVDYYAEKD